MPYCPNCKVQLTEPFPSECFRCGALFGPDAWTPMQALPEEAWTPKQALSEEERSENGRFSIARMLVGLPTFLFGFIFLPAAMSGLYDIAALLALGLFATPVALAFSPRNSVLSFLTGTACVLLCLGGGFYYLVVAIGGGR